MTDEDAFLSKLLEDPADDTVRLVYADWLDEREDEPSLAKAEYLRTELQLADLSEADPARDPLIRRLRALAGQLPRLWAAQVSRVPVENCQFRWRFLCPQKWSHLEPTVNPEVRYCSSCQRAVYYCHTIEDARARAGGAGECVAINIRVSRQPGDLELDDDIVFGELDEEDWDSELDDPEFADEK
jgi:uncharacterized protein (TIGR02996 family)